MTRLSLKGLAGRPLRTLLTTFAIVLGVALVTGAMTLTDTQRKAADALSSAAYNGTDAVVTSKTAFRIDSDDWMAQRPTVDAAVLDKVRALPEVGVAVGDITDQQARVIGEDGKPLGEGPYFGVGLDAAQPGSEQVTPFRLDDGRWAAGAGEVVLDAGTAEDQGFATGDTVKVSTPAGTQPFEIVGIARFGAVKTLGTATVAVFDLGTARGLFDKGDAFDSILVAGREGTPAADVRSAVAGAVGPENDVSTAADHDRFTFEGLKMFISIIKTVLMVFGGVAVLVGALTILNSLSITVAQRTRELGLMRLVGADRRQVLRTVMFEALVIGLLGSAAGLAVGFALAKGLQGLFTSLGLDLPRTDMTLAAGTVVVAFIVGTLVTLIAGLVPAFRATRIAPVAALRDAEAGDVRGGIVGRAIRPVVSLLGRPGERVGGAAGLLARRNALRRPGRTLATASALTIGVALVVLVAVLAAGLRDTTTGDLERRVNATHAVVGSDGWSPIDPKVVDAVAATPGVERVSGVRQDVASAFGDNERVNAVDPATASRMLGFTWTEGSAESIAGLGGDGAVVDEKWAGENGLGMGERFALTSPAGERLDLTVRGIESSPVLDALDLGPITIGDEAFAAADFAAKRNVYTFVDAPGAGDALERAMAPHPDAQALTKAALIDLRTKDIDTLLAIFAVLLALAVLVSLFGIVNALVLAIFERRRELGMLAAIGMTRRQVRRMVRHESIVTALLGVTTGIAVGLLLGWGVTSAFAEEGFTFALPTGQLIVLAIVAVLSGILAAVLPARRASRMSPLSALAYE